VPTAEFTWTYVDVTAEKQVQYFNTREGKRVQMSRSVQIDEYGWYPILLLRQTCHLPQLYVGSTRCVENCMQTNYSIKVFRG
jgi:hypothetical protein